MILQDPVALRSRLASFRKDGSRRFHGHCDEGPSNSVFKALCGHWSADPRWSTPHCTLDVAMARLRSCAVGVVDRWADTCEVLEAQMPWMRFNCSVHENEAHKLRGSRVTGPGQHLAGKRAGLRRNDLDDERLASKTQDGGPGRPGLPRAIQQVILDLNREDMALYQEGLRILSRRRPGQK